MMDLKDKILGYLQQHGPSPVRKIEQALHKNRHIDWDVTWAGLLGMELMHIEGLGTPRNPKLAALGNPPDADPSVIDSSPAISGEKRGLGRPRFDSGPLRAERLEKLETDILALVEKNGRKLSRRTLEEAFRNSLRTDAVSDLIAAGKIFETGDGLPGSPRMFYLDPGLGKPPELTPAQRDLRDQVERARQANLHCKWIVQFEDADRAGDEAGMEAARQFMTTEEGRETIETTTEWTAAYLKRGEDKRNAAKAAEAAKTRADYEQRKLKQL